jgi:hypothetical protein
LVGDVGDVGDGQNDTPTEIEKNDNDFPHLIFY